MSLPDRNLLAEEDEHDLGISRRQPQTSRIFDARKLRDGGFEENHEESSVGSKDPALPIVCRFLSRHGHCRYGNACKFSHSQTYAQLPHVDSEQTTRGTDGRRRKTELCQFFARHGYCRYGWSCRYIHGKPSAKAAVDEPSQGQNHTAKLEFKKQADPTSDGATSVQPVQVASEEETLEELRDREIRQFLRRYRRCREVRSGDGTQRYNFVFEPTDPDWGFDVRQLNLTVTFPKNYPEECITVAVFDDDAILPPLLVRDLNKAISEWLQAKHVAGLEMNPRQLILRAFLRWLDRNLESMFIESLRKVKKIQLAEAAGLEFVPYEELMLKGRPSVNSGSGGLDVTDSKDRTCDGRYLPVVPNAPEDSDGEHPVTKRPDDKCKRSNESNLEVGSLPSGVDKSRQNTIEDEQVPQDESQRTDVPLGNVSERHSSQSNSQDNVDEESDGPLGSGRRLAGAETNNRQQEAPNKTCHTVVANPKRGTEIKFRKLELGENVGTLECQKMALRVQCSRCRCSAEVITPPRRRNVVVCGRCSKTISVVFRPNLMHAFNSVLGFLDLTDCSVLDLMLPACIFATVCLQCDKQTQLDGIHYGQQKTTWCRSCNCKITFLMESIKFQRLQPAGTHDPTKAFVIKAPKAAKKVRDPAIQEGKPLPNNGTCKHYKKSFRWLRFPCCGKAYPCDVCHEEQEGDHEMKYATRMICGHCAKEQPFLVDKPCTGCNAFTTKKATAHWEGGQGCRDRIKMSRDDSKKYSGTGKTISRKAQAGAPGKK